MKEPGTAGLFLDRAEGKAAKNMPLYEKHNGPGCDERRRDKRKGNRQQRREVAGAEAYLAKDISPNELIS